MRTDGALALAAQKTEALIRESVRQVAAESFGVNFRALEIKLTSTIRSMSRSPLTMGKATPDLLLSVPDMAGEMASPSCIVFQTTGWRVACRPNFSTR